MDGVSRYEVFARIAAGGMATVYVGRVRGAVGFSRLVAIKRPHPFVIADADLRRQLEHEARVAAMIHHPNVVSVLDVEQIGDELVLVMDYVDGCTLADLVKHAETCDASIDRVAVRVVLDAAHGLFAAHRLTRDDGQPLGLVHRDVSPQNILVGRDGVARLTDFGIAKIHGGERTATDVLKGKLAYMPPEYVASRTFDARSDLFSLAVIAWEALARRRLFKGEGDLDTLQRIASANVPPLGTIRPELAPLEPVLARALARSPLERHGSVEEFANELEERARRIDAVGTRADVAAWVERAAGEEGVARRKALESSRPRTLLELAREEERPFAARDAIETASLHAPAPFPSADAQPIAAVPPAAPLPRTATRAFVVVAGCLVLGGVALGIRRSTARPVATEPASPPAESARADAPPDPSPSSSPDGAPAPTAPSAASMRSNAPIAPNANATGRRTAPRPPSRPPRGTSPPLLPHHAPPNPYSE